MKDRQGPFLPFVSPQLEGLWGFRGEEVQGKIRISPAPTARRSGNKPWPFSSQSNRPPADGITFQLSQLERDLDTTRLGGPDERGGL